MSLKDNLQLGIISLISKAGKPIRVNYYTQVIGSVYDDDTTLTQSGASLWTSGIVLPINAVQGSFESVLVEQGKLTSQDQRLYTHGSLVLAGSEMQVKIGLGSPNSEQFTTVPLGIISPEVEDQRIYNKVYIRRLPIGSLLGE